MLGVVRRRPSMAGTHLGHVSNWSETRLLSLLGTGPRAGLVPLVRELAN